MIDDNILTLDDNLKMPLLLLPIKMTLVRLQTGVVLISPLPNIERFTTQINAFGKVTDIVAPNLYHNLGIPKASEIYPNARLWGAPGFRQKLPNINWHQEITSGNWPYQQELAVIFIEGMPKMNEVVFIHRNSKTLVVTDLCFNHIHGKGLGYWIIFNLFGTYKRFAVSKLFLKMVKDRKAFIKSVHMLLSEEFDKIVIPHGEIITNNGREKLQEAMLERGII